MTSFSRCTFNANTLPNIVKVHKTRMKYSLIKPNTKCHESKLRRNYAKRIAEASKGLYDSFTEGFLVDFLF